MVKKTLPCGTLLKHSKNECSAKHYVKHRNNLKLTLSSIIQNFATFKKY